MKRFADAFGRLYVALAVLAAWLLLAMVVLITSNILARNFGLGAIRWTDEVSEYGLYAVTLLSAPWLLRLGGHVRVDILLSTLPPRAGWVLEAIADMIGATVSTGLAWYGAAATAQARAAGEVAVKGLVFPEWWLLAPLPVAFLLLGLEFVFRLRRLLAGPRQPTVSNTGGLT